MNTLKRLLFAAVVLVSATYLTSCTKKDDATPDAAAPSYTALVPTGVDLTALTTRSYSFKITVTAPGVLTNLTVTKKVGTVSNPVSGYPKTSAKFTSTSTSEEISIADTLPGNTYADSVVYTVSATDKNSKTNTQSWTVKWKKTTAAYITWSNLTFTSDTVNATTATKKSYFSAVNATTYTPMQAKTNAASVDFGYFQGNSKGTTLFSPSTGTTPAFGPLNNNPDGYFSWTNKNATKFKLVTSDATISYASPVASTLTTALGSGTVNEVNNLANNDIVAFQTSTGKNGLIKVVSTSGSYPSGSLTLEIKYFN
jgi:hypothetical protein